jgi:nucleoside-diphosphate-sugar epimerase
MTAYLVTGGCGFIGQSLIARLLRDRANVVCVIDNLSAGRVEKSATGSGEARALIEAAAAAHSARGRRSDGCRTRRDGVPQPERVSAFN